MLWIFAIVVVLVLGGVVIVAAGHGDGLAPTYDDRPDVLLPTTRPLNGADLRGIRFTMTWRGYRTSEVDALIARLESQLDQHEAAPEALVQPEQPEVNPEVNPELRPDGSPDAEATLSSHDTTNATPDEDRR